MSGRERAGTRWLRCARLRVEVTRLRVEVLDAVGASGHCGPMQPGDIGRADHPVICQFCGTSGIPIGLGVPGVDGAMVAEADVFLDVDAIAARYPIGRNKAYGLVDTPGFPASVVPGMWRVPLVALRVWELATSLATTLVVPRPTAPPAHVAPPPARRPGRPRKDAHGRS